MAGVKVNCRAQYWKPPKAQVYNAGNYNGVDFNYYGSTNGEWSNVYTIAINFYTGKECNNSLGYSKYSDNSIVGLISWDNGGTSVITLSGYTTDEDALTVDSMTEFINNLYPNLYTVIGYDQHNTEWQITLR